MTVRIGDAVVHLTSARVAAQVRQRWDARMFLAMRLRQRVSQSWLHPVLGTYPVAVGVRLTDASDHHRVRACRPHHTAPGAPEGPRGPAPVAGLRSGSVGGIGDAWFEAQRYLEQ